MDENADGGTIVSVATENATSTTVDDDRFEVAGGNLKLKDGTTLDFESDTSPIDVTITASGDGDSATHTVSVSINDVNEDFTLAADDGAVDENADGASVGAVTVTDPDAGDTHTYEVSDDRFEVADGMLKLKDGMTLDYETDTSIMVTVTATDSGGFSHSVDVTVTVNGVNEAPSISVADGTTPDGMTAASTIDENAMGLPVGEIMLSDPDAGDTHTLAVSDDRFEASQDAMGGWWLKLKDGESLDHEAEDSVMVTVTVTDAGGLSASADVTVTVNDVNEAPSAPEIRGLPRSVDENDDGAVIASLETGTDPEGDPVSFSVDDDRFEVIAGGVLKLKDDASLDYEGDGGSVDIVVTAMDPSGAMSDPTIVTVEIEDENEAPSIMADDDDVDENEAGAVLSAITLSDQDAGDELSVRVSDFRFTAITDDNGDMWLALKEGESLDHEDEESVALTLTVTDSGGLTDTVDVTVTVNNVNENPSVSIGQGVTPGGVIAAPTVDENDAGVPVGELTVSDPDADDTYELSVSDARFEASQDALGGWWVKLRDDQSFDFETDESVTITVTVTDGGGLTGTADLMITVRNVDEAPSAPVVRDGQLSVAENAAGASITSLADSVDPEGDAITYSVNDDRFEVTSGLVLKLKDGMSLDHETEESVTLMLTASDPANNTSEATMVTVMVTNVNEGPTISAADGSVDENAAGAMVGAVSATDPDAGDSHTYSTDNTNFEVADGMLKLVDGASLNYEDGDSVTVMVTVTDAAGLSDSAEVTVTVNDVNEDPSIDVRDGEIVPVVGATSSLTVAENAMGADLPPLALIELSDPDAADAGMLMGRDGMMATTVDDDRFEVKLDDEGGLWLALKAGESLDHEAEDGMVDVMVTFTDSAMNTAEATATVVVTDLNEAPTSVTLVDSTTPDGHPASSTVDENVEGAVLGEIVVEDPDDGDDWTPSVTDDRFEVSEDDAGGWWLKLKDGVSLDYESGGMVDVEITVEDSGGLTAMTTATITVSNIVESPTAPTARATTLAVDENDAGADISVLDSSDPQGDAFTFQVDDDRFEVTDQGVLKLKTGEMLDHEMEASVDLVLTATDEHGHVSNETMVTVTVTDLNEAPTVNMDLPDVNDGVAGAALEFDTVQLEKLFTDEDDTDVLFAYRLAVDKVSGNGDLTLDMSVEYITYTATAPTVANAEYEYTAPDPAPETPTAMAIGAVTFTDPDLGGAHGRGDSHTYAVDDDRFEVDDDGMLVLKAGEMLTAEATVTVTVTDSYGLSGTGTITVTIASEDGDSGDTSDGGGMNDGDGMGDTSMPDPATKDVTFINGSITGMPPAGAYGEWTVAVVASDDEGASSRAEFTVYVDDGNDQPTAIRLANNDGTNNAAYQVTVDENDDSGVALGTVTVEDIDSPNHPHGQHAWTTNNPKFEVTDSGVLMLKAGESLDYETDGAAVTVIVTATDKNGAMDGLDVDVAVQVTVNDKNDAPEAADEIGDWWVTIPEGLNASNVIAGQWLSFGLEREGIPGDTMPAFTDEDAGDTLTYSITGGSAAVWLEIDATSGAITNKAGKIADPGKYTVTVRATDQGEDRTDQDNADGEHAEITFMIIVAESGPNNVDNDQPDVDVELVGRGYVEGTGKQAVATVTVTDDDFALSPHPYGLLKDGKPILGGAIGGTDNTGSNADPSGADNIPDANADTGQFELSETYTQVGNSRTWKIYAKEGNTLDFETAGSVTISVTAYNDLNGDGVYDTGEGEQRAIVVDIDGANEAPEFTLDTNTSGSDDSANQLTAGAMGSVTIVQEQAHTAKTTLYLNLYDLWSDEDEVDNAVTDSDFRFSATTTTPWIKVLHNAVRWGDIKDGADGVSGNADDITWGGGATPDDTDLVAIVEIDRMTNIDQTEDGTITLTATDDEGATGTQTITVDITDEDVAIPFTVDTDNDNTPDAIGGTVRIMGVLREGNSLSMSFDYTKDPDLSSGDWVLVEYTWTVTNPADDITVRTVTSYGSPAPLTLAQGDVGMEVSASVMYYQLTPGTGDIAAVVTGGSADATGTVANAHDAGDANIVYTTSGTTLMAEVSIMDEDGVDLDDTGDATPPVGNDRGTAPVYTWQQSDNGVGGWSNVTDADTSDTMVTGTVAGKYYRLVITYTDAEGASERIAGDPIKIGTLATKAAPAVTGSVAVGGTLIVDSGTGSVQWQRQMDPTPTDTTNGDEYWVDLPGATGNLALTSAHAGMTLRALVTYTDANGATAIVAAANQAVPAGTNTAPVSLGSHDIEAVIADQAANSPAVITRVEETVDIAALFQDADGDRLTFTHATPEGLSGGNYLRFDATTGKLLYITDNQGGQGGNGSADGTGGDGAGNVVTITVTANDGTATVTSNVNIRLNVDGQDLAGTLTIAENSNDRSAETVDLNIVDQNLPSHDFGSYDWGDPSDDRFEITPSTSDSSQATLSVKDNATFNTDGSDGTITVTITATDKAGDHTVTVTVTVTVTNDSTDDPAPGTTPDQVPGLKDDENGGDGTETDEADDDGGGSDTDQDGGLPPPPPPMMMIEDDLLDDFVIAIDDIDIA